MMNLQTPTTFIIADDDPMHRLLTLSHLALIPNLVCVGELENAFEVAELVKIEKPDLLVLDIEMPGISGLELARSIKDLPFIVFITSHSGFAKEAFDVDAIDFLTKPTSPDRLLRAIEKVRTLLEMKKNIHVQEGFNINADNSFFIKDKSAFIRINYADVLYIESMADFVMIFLKDGSKHIALANLRSVENQLPHNQFIRISRSHIVYRQAVTSIEHSSLFLDKIHLSIGKTYTDFVLPEIVGNAALKRFV